MRLSYLGAPVVVAVMATVVGENRASACGGCFHEPTPPQEDPSMITAHRMILSISSKQTTLYDQIQYSGNPKSFAWVLPISGEAEVGLSADIVFSTLGSMTETQVVPPPMNCPSPPSGYCDYRHGFFNGEDDAPSAAGGGSFADAGSASGTPVTVTKEETVGPYETVQLHSTDADALNTWLTDHNFTIPDDVKPIVAQYVNEHFDFLAMKLVPGAGVQAMRPVRVSTKGAAPILPLRMVAAGTGATVGITLWVVGEGRYEPQNFPWFKIDVDELSWDWQKSQSNFAELRASKTASTAGRGWEVESSTDLTRQQIVNTITYASYPSYDAGADYSAKESDAGSETPAQVRSDDIEALFSGIASPTVRVTRLRGDLAHAALTTDLSLQASADQAQLPLYRQITKELNEPTCPIYEGCNVVGSGTRTQATAAIANHDYHSSASCASTSLRRRVPSTLAFASAFGIVGLVTAVRITRRKRTR